MAAPRIPAAGGTPTVRRHPRTTAEAFPGTAEYADPIEGPHRREGFDEYEWAGIVLTVGVLAFAVAAFLGVL